MKSHAPCDPQSPLTATESRVCRLPWSRHHSAALTLPGSQQALPASLALLGRWEGAGMGRGVSTQPPSCLSLLKQLDPRKVSSAWAWERECQKPQAPQPLPRWPHFSGCALSRECLPVGSQSLPPTVTVPLSPSQGWDPWHGSPTGKEASVSCPAHTEPALFPSFQPHPGE